MFYSHWLKSNKRTLGAIWVAGYFFKRLKKDQIRGTDVSSSVDKILQYEINSLHYRVLAYLLLGVVRIYSAKVAYLSDDCNKLLLQLNKLALKQKKGVNMPKLSEPYSGITIPESFELDAFDLGILEGGSGSNVLPRNVLPQDQITLKDGDRNRNILPCFHDKYHYGEFDTRQETCSTFEDITNDTLSALVMRIVTEATVRENAESVADDVHFEVSSPFRYEPGESSGTKERSTGEDLLNQSKKLKVSTDEDITNDDLADLVMKVVTEATVRENADSLAEDVHFEASCAFGGYERGESSGEKERSIQEDNLNQSKKLKVSVDTCSEKGGDGPISTMQQPNTLSPPGATVREFEAILTPATRERPRAVKKKKCVMDFPPTSDSSLMNEWLEDSSDLLRQRKVPTLLAAWRAQYTSRLPECFFEPLISHNLSGNSVLPNNKKSGNVDSRKKPRMTESGVAASLHDEVPRPSVLEQEPCMGAGSFEQTDMAPETPVRIPVLARSLKSPVSLMNDNPYRSGPSSPCYGAADEPFPNYYQDFELSMTNEINIDDGGDRQQLNRLSERKRMVASCLENVFMKQKESGKDETVSLSHLLEGRSKKDSAMFFYEILALKTEGRIDVKQAEAYADIVVLKGNQHSLNKDTNEMCMA